MTSTLLRGARWVGVAVALCGAALITTGASGQPAAEAREGGTLVVALAEDPDALDPTLARTFVGRMVFLHMCEKLYDLNAKLEIVPQLAAALPTISADKRTMTIRIRRGIRFNDGTALDAAAVKTSLDRHRTLARSARASELAPVSAVEVAGPLTVRLRLSAPYAPLTAQLADRAGMIMSPKQLAELGDRFATNPVCVGPFRFVSRAAGDRITLAKSTQYYGRSRVHLAQIVFRIITDTSARAANLRSGDVQVLDRIASTDLPAIARDRNLRVIKATSIGYQGISFNIGNKNGLGKPFENVGTPLASRQLLRQAFELSIDRRVINRVVFGGTVLPGCLPVPPTSPYYDRTIRCPARNVAQARSIIQRTGVDTPVRVRLMIGTDQVQARLGQVIQSMAQEAGFAVTLAPTEFVTVAGPPGCGQLRLVRDRLVGPHRPRRQHLPVRPLEGLAQQPRVVVAAHGPAARQRAQGDDAAGPADAVLGGVPDPPLAAAAALPLAPGQPARREPQRPRRANLRRRPDPRVQRRVHSLTRGRRSWASSSSGSSEPP